MYYGRTQPRHVAVGGQIISVDSALEERVIRQLDAEGYHGFWERPKRGISVGKHNYTPDLELSVFFEGSTQRALVELKPSRSFFTAAIADRMCGVASYYYCQLLLVYFDKPGAWYRLNQTDHTLSRLDLPPPGRLPITRLYRPLSLPGRTVYNHRYTQRFQPLMLLLNGCANLIETIIIGPQRKNRRR